MSSTVAITEAALYRGSVWHTRRAPVRHDFSYRLWLAWLDLDRVDETLMRSRWWGRAWRPVTFRDQDFLDQSRRPLAEKVRAKAEQLGMDWSTGRIMMLGQLRIFGWLFNPLVLYWHFPEGAQQPDAVLAEVSNNPWHERHWYPLPLEPAQQHADQSFTLSHAKAFHVSPFMQMAMDYHWRLMIDEDDLQVRIDNHDTQGKLFTAGLKLRRLAVNSRAMRQIIPEFGWQTLLTSLRIYRQAWKLWRLGVPFVAHPDKDKPAGRAEPSAKGRRR